MRINKWFLTLYALFLPLGLFLLIFLEKGDLVLYLNRFHSPVLDKFFYYWTYLGDGYILLALFFILIFIKYRYVLMLASTSLISTLFVHLFKRILFRGTVRPRLFFEEKGIMLSFVEGVNVHALHSFPSGHTATAFAVATLLAHISRSNFLSIIYFFCALLVGVSRMYLSQHFFVDVYFGSLFGVLSTILSIMLVEHYSNKSNKRWVVNGKVTLKKLSGN